MSDHPGYIDVDGVEYVIGEAYDKMREHAADEIERLREHVEHLKEKLAFAEQTIDKYSEGWSAVMGYHGYVHNREVGDE